VGRKLPQKPSIGLCPAEAVKHCRVAWVDESDTYFIRCGWCGHKVLPCVCGQDDFCDIECAMRRFP
jgi:hypothetical protein